VVDADRQRLRPVLENLGSNAVKHTGDHGRISITAARDTALIEAHGPGPGRPCAIGAAAGSGPGPEYLAARRRSHSP
jgi:hypothetical protein